MDMGLMQCAIGDGKGKTTALIGQLVRAQGQGFKCVCFQFLKTQPSGECAALGERAAHQAEDVIRARRLAGGAQMIGMAEVKGVIFAYYGANFHFYLLSFLYSIYF